MSNAAGDQHVPSREGEETNPYGLRFRLPEQPGQLEGWVAEIEQSPTVEELPSTEELRDLLEGKISTPAEKQARRLRALGLLVALVAALFWLYFIRKSLMEMISVD